MTHSSFTLPRFLAILAVSSSLVTGQDQPRSRIIPPPVPSSQVPEQAETLNTNYRVTFAGKSDNKSLGEISTLTCSKNFLISGPLNSFDTPTTLSVSGTLEEKHGLIILNYSILLRVPVVASTQPVPAVPPGSSRSVQYQDHSSQGTLKMKPGKTYDLLKSGGNIYSIVLAPENEK